MRDLLLRHTTQHQSNNVRHFFIYLKRGQKTVWSETKGVRQGGGILSCWASSFFSSMETSSASNLKINLQMSDCNKLSCERERKRFRVSPSRSL